MDLGRNSLMSGHYPLWHNSDFHLINGGKDKRATPPPHLPILTLPALHWHSFPSVSWGQMLEKAMISISLIYCLIQIPIPFKNRIFYCDLKITFTQKATQHPSMRRPSPWIKPTNYQVLQVLWSITSYWKYHLFESMMGHLFPCIAHRRGFLCKQLFWTKKNIMFFKKE